MKRSHSVSEIDFQQQFPPKLLRRQSSLANSDDINGYRFFDELTSGSQFNKKYRTQAYFTTFVLRNLEFCSRPEEALKSVFRLAINNAIENGENHLDGPVTMYGVLISGEDLEKPIPLPIRPVKQNSVDAIVAEFQRVNQSESYDSSLFKSRIHIRITTISLPEGGSPPKKFQVLLGVNKDRTKRTFFWILFVCCLRAHTSFCRTKIYWHIIKS